MSSHSSELFNLPNEMLVMILSNLSAKDMENLCSTTKELKEICNLVWKIKYEKEFGKVNNNVMDATSWKDSYHKKMMDRFVEKIKRDLNRHFDEKEFGTIQKSNEILFDLLEYIYKNKEILNLKKLKKFKEVLEIKLYEFLDTVENMEDFAMANKIKLYLKEIFGEK
jgi:hypothetical protein